MSTEITAQRDIRIITEEISFYKNQAGESILEIGRRLNEAKELLTHGAWLGWLSEVIEFSEATAQRFMRLAREYANPSPVTDLGASKALVLLALPPSEREEFAGEEHEVGGKKKTAAAMTKRELEKAVRERAEALELQAAAEAAAEESKRAAEEAAEALAAADGRAEEARIEIERVQAEKAALDDELEKLRNAEPVIVTENPDQLVIEAFKEEAAKAARKEAEEKYKKKMTDANAAKETAEKQAADAGRERDAIKKKLAEEQAAAAERVERLEKQLKAASSEAVTVFKTHFENAQTCVNGMLACIAKLDDAPETREKLAAALRALCEKTVARMGDVAPMARHSNDVALERDRPSARIDNIVESGGPDSTAGLALSTEESQ
ncbi:MAG: DUF3102 domain-containing protein [Oscillospiraceae bacterium]|jgi:chromosome segregation ATPase|nr:DUF3102 domain-containing protein [Oscillospiraceae bacterium]